MVIGPLGVLVEYLFVAYIVLEKLFVEDYFVFVVEVSKLPVPWVSQTFQKHSFLPCQSSMVTSQDP